MLFANFWRKSIGSARLAAISQLEYRFNLFTDAIIQPVMTAGIEAAMWIGIFGASAGAGGSALIAGFPRSSYLAYALWTPFFARLAANWMYEFRMSEEIESGSVNAVLARPISFYEFYLAQFIGYKTLTGAISFLPPLIIFSFIESPTHLERVPLAVGLVLFYLILVHTISFTIASCGFYFNNVNSITVAKNIGLWMLTGELFPLDMAPPALRSVLLALPFSSAVYRPVGFIIGRVGFAEMWRGFASVAISIVICGVIARAVWLGGRRRYSGTGA